MRCPPERQNAMIKWYGTEPKLTGFTYFPLLEIGVGIFLMIAAIVVPTLFVYYNGIKAENWGELLFCACFFALFAFMGRSLTFQSLSVKENDQNWVFFQDMRDPPVSFLVKKYDWEDIQTKEIKEKDETFIVLILNFYEGDQEFYRSVNRNEINSIVKALETLHKSDN